MLICQTPPNATQIRNAVSAVLVLPPDAVRSPPSTLAWMRAFGLVGIVAAKDEHRSSEATSPPTIAETIPAVAPSAMRSAPSGR
jgi:hypothetical protein